MAMWKRKLLYQLLKVLRSLLRSWQNFGMLESRLRTKYSGFRTKFDIELIRGSLISFIKLIKDSCGARYWLLYCVTIFNFLRSNFNRASLVYNFFADFNCVHFCQPTSKKTITLLYMIDLNILVYTVNCTETMLRILLPSHNSRTLIRSRMRYIKTR